MSVDTWSEEEPAEAVSMSPSMRVGRLRPKLGVADLFLQLWRAKLMMFLIVFAFVLAGLAITLIFPTKYTASTRLLVTLGQEYVFNPIVGDAARGAYLQQEEVLSAERELAASPMIAERVIERVGLERLFPKLAKARMEATGDRTYSINQKALEAFARAFGASTRPRSSVLRLYFSHEDGDVSAETLNVFVDEYLKYRTEVLSGRAGAGVSVQRGVIEGRVKEADTALQAFLARSGVSDFEAEKEAVTGLYAMLSESLIDTQASLSEAEGRVRALRSQLTTTDQKIDLYNESASEQELVALQVEREQLLSRYKSDSSVVRDIDQRIAQMQRYVNTGDSVGLRRVGPNPIYQSMQSDLGSARADVVALRQKAEELVRQREAAEDRRRALAASEPDYRKLARDRDALNTAADAFADREQSDRATSELEAQKAGNITLYEAARAPRRGSSPKRAIAFGAAFLGLLTAIVIGLLRAWSQTTLSTASSAERTLGLTVLAKVREGGAS